MTGASGGRCDKLLLVQAEFDGELDAAAAAELAGHRADCPQCQVAAAELARSRILTGQVAREGMPDDTRARIVAALARAQPRPMRRRLWPGLWEWRWISAGFGAGAACAAAIALLLLSPGAAGLTEQIVGGHIRALQPGHLEDVASSDRHTVKPWFEGRLDFSPPVKDLAAERFPLKGARLDYIGGRLAAALVYQRDKHIIDLFTWPAQGPGKSPSFARHQGYNVVHWTQDGMTYWAVSDLEAAQLSEFAETFRRSP
jgi:anti-sigma factor RsiW